jgi:hypothetical protein
VRKPIKRALARSSGYAQLYPREILRADRGCDFNFLRKEPLAERR